jgi:Fe2+ transport system protein B
MDEPFSGNRSGEAGIYCRTHQRAGLQKSGSKRLQVQETVRRYQNADKILSDVISKKPQFKELLTEKLDKVLVHKFWGYVVFLLILLIIFQSVFFLAEYPMNWIDSFFSWLTAFTSEHLPEGPVNSLISNGIIPGIGGIVVFAPQIGILLYFLYFWKIQDIWRECFPDGPDFKTFWAER